MERRRKTREGGVKPPYTRPGNRSGEAWPWSGQGVGEVVGVVAVFDDDLHGAVEAGELVGAGIRDDDYV